MELELLDCAKNAHLNILAGLHVTWGATISVLVDFAQKIVAGFGVTLSWQPWWMPRGRGGRLNFSTSAEDS